MRQDTQLQATVQRMRALWETLRRQMEFRIRMPAVGRIRALRVGKAVQAEQAHEGVLAEMGGDVLRGA
jgi:hypothetical protein